MAISLLFVVTTHWIAGIASGQTDGVGTDTNAPVSAVGEAPEEEPVGVPAGSPEEAIAIDSDNVIAEDDLLIPTPGEFFSAMDKVGSPDWSAHFRKPIPTTFTNRAQIALNLGGLITDGYIAVAARDGQQVKNIGRDIISLAKSIGVGDNVIGRGNSITQFAEDSDWEALHEELEATEKEVKLSMKRLKDDDLVAMVSLGAWIRGIEVVSSIVGAGYSQDRAQLLRQPELLAHLRGKVPAMSEASRGEPLVEAVYEDLGKMESYVDFPVDKVPSQEEVKSLNAASKELSEKISTK